MNSNLRFFSRALVGNLNRIALVIVLCFSASAFRCNLNPFSSESTEGPKITIQNATVSRDEVTDLPLVTVDYTVKYPSDLYIQTMTGTPNLTCTMEQGQLTGTRTFKGKPLNITGTTAKPPPGQATVEVPEEGRYIAGSFNISCTLASGDKALGTSNTVSVDVPKPTDNSGDLLQQPNPPEVKENYNSNLSNGTCTYTFTATTAKINCVTTENTIEVNWTFDGIPSTLKPGETVTIKVTGTISKRDIATNVWKPTVDVSASGMTQVSGQSVAVGDLSTGWTPNAESSYVFKVDPNATEVTITLHGDYGIGNIAVYRYEKRK